MTARWGPAMTMLKQLIRRSLHLVPGGRRVGARINRHLLAGRPAEEVFTSIYATNAWGSRESVSGEGSTLAETEVIRRVLPEVLRELSVTSLLDIPCGDVNWMKTIDLTGVEYTGADIVPSLVEANTQRHARPGVRFVKLDLLTDPLPRADLVLVRDCLGHFSYADVLRAVHALAESGAPFLLLTTHAGRGPTADIATGQWRPLDLEAPPIQLPAPARLIEEQHRDPRYADKCLGLWSGDDLRAWSRARRAP